MHKNGLRYESRIPKRERVDKFCVFKVIEAAAFGGEVIAMRRLRRMDSCIPKKRGLLTS
jgi:hypothetical protein